MEPVEPVSAVEPVAPVEPVTPPVPPAPPGVPVDGKTVVVEISCVVGVGVGVVAATVVAGVGLLGVVLTAAGVVLVASCDVALGDTALAGESTGTRTGTKR